MISVWYMENTEINLIFDMVLPHGYSKEEERTLLNQVIEKIGQLDERYQCVITMEKSFVAETKRKVKEG